jgi:CO/xanthine dehydrogenase Mo-binding subunit
MPGFIRNFAGWTAKSLLEATELDPTSVEGASDMEYAVENMNVSFVLDDPGVPIGFWRSVGHSYTGFVVECFIDEIAHAVKQDPYEFRRNLLKHSPQRKQVLELAAKKAGWGSLLPQGTARGIAQVASFGSYAAQVAEVELVGANEIRVRKIVCAFDCGYLVNPDQVRAQIESGIIFGLSAALKDAITFEAGSVQQSNFHDYRVLRLDETPEIEIYLVEEDDKPRGAGEPAVPPVAPAVANAIFALTGQRLRKLPLRLE